MLENNIYIWYIGDIKRLNFNWRKIVNYLSVIEKKIGENGLCFFVYVFNGIKKFD